MTESVQSAAVAGARADWQARIGLRRDDLHDDGAVLAGVTGLTATSGRAQVTLDWEPVNGAIGYLVHRAEGESGPWAALDHFGGDVLAVPHPPYADTTGRPGQTYHYAVCALADIGRRGPLSAAVAAASHALVDIEPVDVLVHAATVVGPLARPWRQMVGSEHLSHLLSVQTTGGRLIGAELAEALVTVHNQLGVSAVRAHAILGDDLGVYREVGGEPVHDFSQVGEVYDRLMSLGLRPVVELSFMPRDLARDPDATVFDYRAIVSPPKDWRRWADLIESLVGYLVDRYGLDEVRHWPFEVWNEANLEVFWSGTRAEFMRLYDVTARAVKNVDPSLRVGGPSSAAAGWVGELLTHVEASGAPIDFVSTHTYGSPPLDFRPICARHGRPDLEILWTEWGVTPTHFAPVSDSVFAAAFVLRGMRSAAGRVPALAYWVASDHFEELGRPPRLFHGGFGLLTVGNLRKPRFWALELLNRLGDDELRVTLRGDGAGALVQAWAARDGDGTLGVLVWNATLDQSKVDGDPQLDRRVQLFLDGLTDGDYQLRHWRIDHNHSNIRAVWQDISDRDWPDDDQWRQLRARDTIDEYAPRRLLSTTRGTVRVDFPLPMPGVSFLSLTPAGAVHDER